MISIDKYRIFFSGEDEVGQKYPRPAKFKFTRHQSYPEPLQVFDYVYDKRKNGQWVTWLDTMERVTKIAPYTIKLF